MTKIKPLPHQIKVLEELAKHKKALVQLPSGSGKTHLMVFDVQRKKPKSMLYLIHRNEILQQSANVFIEHVDFMNKDNVGILNGNSKDYDKPYLFSTVQTLSKTNNLQKVDWKIQYFIGDEWHHSAAKTYQTILDYFEPEYLYGLTATPRRTDLKNITDKVDNMIIGNIDIFTGIEQKILTPIHYIGLYDQIDYSNVRHNGYNYYVNDVDKTLLVPWRDLEVIRNYIQYIVNDKRKHTIGFCNSVKHVDRMVALFNKEGIKSKGISYHDNYKERAPIIEQFRKGQIQVLFTRDLLNEGIDFPECDSLMFLRPTFAEIVFLQQLGRGLRKNPNKKDVLVLDYIGNSENVYMKRGYLDPFLAGKPPMILEPGKMYKPQYTYYPQSIVEFAPEVINIMDLQEKMRRKAYTDQELIDNYYEVKRKKNEKKK